MGPTALLSVSDKTGLVPLARTLQQQHGFRLICSGGTARVLKEAGLDVILVSDHTGAPEMLGGRVKTLHPRIHGGILAERNNPGHRNDLQDLQIPAIDLVVVNLYPFEATTAGNPQLSWEEAVEVIDIGGPAMLRAAAKNHEHVSVLTAPSQYDTFLKALAGGEVSVAYRRQLALAAFRHSVRYDTAISRWMAARLDEQEPLELAVPHHQRLRYGENPHQQASWHAEPRAGWAAAQQLQGKQLSFNNLLDLDAAQATIREFPEHEPTAVVVKHTNPCGVATCADLATALERALAADSTSAFGGIVALNQAVDANTAKQLSSIFLECVVAPAFTAAARDLLATKPNLRLLTLSAEAVAAAASRQQIRTVMGGLLVQDPDHQPVTQESWKVISKTKPSDAQLNDLLCAWRVVRHVRSNAIVVAKAGQTLGIGAGQMNRVGAASLALAAAGEQARGAVLASDGFFPFDDTVRMAAAHGICGVVQPGGSRRDADSVAACDELGLVMVFTDRRHFLH